MSIVTQTNENNPRTAFAYIVFMLVFGQYEDWNDSRPSGVSSVSGSQKGREKVSRKKELVAWTAVVPISASIMDPENVLELATCQFTIPGVPGFP